MHIKSVTLNSEKYPTQEHYPFNLQVFHQTKRITFDTPVTLFVGENGSGKSTLLEALAHVCGIHIWRSSQVTRYQYNRYEKLLHHYIELEWANGRVPGAFFGSDIFKDFANILDTWASMDPGQLTYFGGKSLVTQSHGQSMMSYFRSRYKLEGIYLIDEPETALSPKTQLEFLNIIRENSQAGHAQFIMVTHSPILLACPDAKIYSFDQTPVQTVKYEDTEHYQVYKDFLSNRNKFLERSNK
ncbi:MAG: AAA family ATPase [Calditrichaceae bacterium]